MTIRLEQPRVQAQVIGFSPDKLRTGTLTERDQRALDYFQEDPDLYRSCASMPYPSEIELTTLLDDCGVTLLVETLGVRIATYISYLNGVSRMPRVVQRLWWWLRVHTPERRKN